MVLELDPHAGVPIYRQVMDELRLQVMTRRLAEGERIESVSALSARLKVNPMTISKAYGLLVEEGLLERRRGVGLFVRSIRKDVRQRQRDRMLNQAMNKVAALAVQMGVAEEEALRLFEEQYRTFVSPPRSEES